MYKIILDYQFMGPQMEQQIKQKGRYALQASTILQVKKIHEVRKALFVINRTRDKKQENIHYSFVYG